MLTVSNAARTLLLSKLHRKNAAEGVAMRFTRKTKGWKLRADEERKNDTVFTHEGRSVLILDSAVAKEMATLTLDVRMEKSGARLRLHRTRAED
jgi:hypothetical protein